MVLYIFKNPFGVIIAPNINATTINTAYAMGLEQELGSIAIGKKANLFINIPKKEHNNNLGQSFLSIFSFLINRLKTQNKIVAPNTLNRTNPYASI